MPKRGKESRLRKACEESASRGERINQLERAQLRLQRLCDISKLLLRFESVEQTLPEVMALLAETLPLRSALFILKTACLRQTIAWLPEGEDTQQLQAAKTHAESAYRYLVSSDVDLGCEPCRTLGLPRQVTSAPDSEPLTQPNFVMLPLVAGRGPVFGALQVEGATKLKEPDVIFVNAVVNQLATALDRHFVDRALRESEAKVAGIISIAADAIIVVDEDQRITMFNAGAEKIFGYSKAEAIGAPLEMLIPERFRAVHRRHVERFSAGGEVARRIGERGSVILGLRKNGEEFPADAAISKLDVGSKRVLTVAVRDVSEQKRIEREQRFLAEAGLVLATTLEYEETLSKLAELAVQELADHCIVYVVPESGEVRRLKVLSRDPAKEWVCAALMRIPLDHQRPHLIWLAFETKQPVLIEDVSSEMVASWAQSDEHLRVLRGLAPKSVIALPLLAHEGVLGVLALVSSTRAYGQPDLWLAKELAHRAALSIENARLYRAANRATQVRDDVLGVVAHDLRNPLGTILMQASLLRRPGGPERRSRKPAETIERAGNHMSRLIEDLLDVHRIEAGQLGSERSRLRSDQLIYEALETQKPLASSASLELKLELSPNLPDVWADSDRLLQVFENLIGNAMKFTQPGGRVTVGATPRDNEALFWVADTGAGISAEDVPHLFDRFWQAKKAGRRGAGLGLPIVKGIVEAYGGHIWVESTPGRGSTFYFTIPFAPRAERWRRETAHHTH